MLIPTAGISQELYRLPDGCSKEDYIPGQLIVKFIPGMELKTESETLNQALQSFGAKNLQAKFPFSPRPKTESNAYGQRLVDPGLFYEILFDSTFSVEMAINILLATQMFEYAVPHFISNTCYTPSDPNLSMQYALTNIKAYQAWDICKGDSNKVIGITDTGIEFAHPDLNGAIKYNENDPLDGIDNDNDGYTDNYRGWDLGSWDNNPQYSSNGHGIHVSGIAGATADNAFGMAGSSFSCSILPVKVDNQYGNLVATYEGIVYAADHGADVINCSWGSSFYPGQYGQDIINYATFNCGALVVAAAGNSNSLNFFYPASYQYVLSVAATDNADIKWSNSSYGYLVDLSAPGYLIHSTWAGSGFTNSSGTSMAAPCVAGAAALVSSYFPSFSMLQVAEQIRNSADVIDTISGNLSWARWLGMGRLNMYRALTDSILPAVRVDSYTFTDSADQTFFPGDTIFIGVTALNYLDTSSSSLAATLESLSPYVVLIDSVWNIGVLNTLQYDSNNLHPFSFRLLNAPPSTKIEFLVHFTDGIWKSFDYLVTNVNKDYKTLDTNQITVTITSSGNVAYNDVPNFIQGEGFRLSTSASLVSGFGLMLGKSNQSVSDNLYSIIIPVDTDFVSETFVQEITHPYLGDQCFYSRYNDYGADSVNRNLVTIEQWSYAWAGGDDDRSMYLRYKIRNDSTTTVENLYSGLFADWDIITSSENRAWYDYPRDAIISSNLDTTLIIAIRLISDQDNFYYAVDNDGFNSSICLTDGFTGSEKLTMMRTNRINAGTEISGNDVSVMAGAGPFDIAQGDSVVLTYVIVGAHNMQELDAALERAILRYNDPLLLSPSRIAGQMTLYPNPASSELFLVLPANQIPSEAMVFDASGRLLIHHHFGNEKGQPIPLGSLQQGMYYVRLTDNSGGLFTASFVVIP